VRPELAQTEPVGRCFVHLSYRADSLEQPLQPGLVPGLVQAIASGCDDGHIDTSTGGRLDLFLFPASRVPPRATGDATNFSNG
jgi:hypothetical protein